MKNTIALAIILFLLPISLEAKPTRARRTEVVTETSQAPKAGDIGVGGMVGTIISVSGKYWISNQGAVDFGLGLVGAPWVVVYADYLWHLPRIFGTNSQ